MMYVRGGLGSRRIHDIIRVPNHVSCRWAAKHTNIENSYEIERENKKGVLVLPKIKKIKKYSYGTQRKNKKGVLIHRYI